MPGGESRWLLDHDLQAGSRVGLKLAIRGSSSYVPVLRRAFPAPTRWYGPFDSFDARFDYVVYAQDVDAGGLDRFLALAARTLLIPTALDECWALDMHMCETGRSSIGELVYRAKTYPNKPGDPTAAKELGRQLADLAAGHPVIARADHVIGVPAKPSKKPYNLPEFLAEQVADALNRPFDNDLVHKTRTTVPIKDLPNEQKVAALQGAYTVTRSVHGETIVIVDDLLRSGTTIATIANLLRDNGAAAVIGLVATKTLRSERDDT